MHLASGFTQFYLDVVGVSQEHCETINAHSPACSWWQTIFQRCAEGLINEHGFIITLSFGLKKIQLKLVTTMDTQRTLQPYRL